jgi:hypothetical protein
MKRYKAKDDCFVNLNFHKKGEVFEFEGKPLHFMQEVDEDGKPVKESKPSAEAVSPSKDQAVKEPSKASPQAGKSAI